MTLNNSEDHRLKSILFFIAEPVVLRGPPCLMSRPLCLPRPLRLTIRCQCQPSMSSRPRPPIQWAVWAQSERPNPFKTITISLFLLRLLLLRMPNYKKLVITLKKHVLIQHVLKSQNWCKSGCVVLSVCFLKHFVAHDSLISWPLEWTIILSMIFNAILFAQNRRIKNKLELYT